MEFFTDIIFLDKMSWQLLLKNSFDVYEPLGKTVRLHLRGINRDYCRKLDHF